MQDRFKFKYVFKKDFGGKTGICYKMPIFDLNEVTSDNFTKVIKGYTDFGYKLVSIEQCTGLKDKNGKLIFGGDIVKLFNDEFCNIHTVKFGDFAMYSLDFQTEYEKGLPLYMGGI